MNPSSYEREWNEHFETINENVIINEELMSTDQSNLESLKSEKKLRKLISSKNGKMRNKEENSRLFKNFKNWLDYRKLMSHTAIFAIIEEISSSGAKSGYRLISDEELHAMLMEIDRGMLMEIKRLLETFFTKHEYDNTFNLIYKGNKNLKSYFIQNRLEIRERILSILRISN